MKQDSSHSNIQSLQINGKSLPAFEGNKEQKINVKHNEQIKTGRFQRW